MLPSQKLHSEQHSIATFKSAIIPMSNHKTKFPTTRKFALKEMTETIKTTETWEMKILLLQATPQDSHLKWSKTKSLNSPAKKGRTPSQR